MILVVVDESVDTMILHRCRQQKVSVLICILLTLTSGIRSAAEFVDKCAGEEYSEIEVQFIIGLSDNDTVTYVESDYGFSSIQSAPKPQVSGSKNLQIIL